MDHVTTGTSMEKQASLKIPEHGHLPDQENKKSDTNKEDSPEPGPSRSVFSDATKPVNSPTLANVIIQEIEVPSESSTESFVTCISGGTANNHGDADPEEPRAQIVSHVRDAVFRPRVRRQGEVLSCAMWIFCFDMITEVVAFAFGSIVQLTQSLNSIQIFAQNERAITGIFIVAVISLAFGCSIFCGREQLRTLQILHKAWRYRWVTGLLVVRMLAFGIISSILGTLLFKILTSILAVIVCAPEIWILYQLTRFAVSRQDARFDVHFQGDPQVN